MDKVKAVAIGVGPGASFVFGVLAGGTMGFWHWLWVLLGIACVLWMSFILVAFVALRAWRHEENRG